MTGPHPNGAGAARHVAASRWPDAVADEEAGPGGAEEGIDTASVVAEAFAESARLRESGALPSGFEADLDRRFLAIAEDPETLAEEAAAGAFSRRRSAGNQGSGLRLLGRVAQRSRRAAGSLAHSTRRAAGRGAFHREIVGRARRPVGRDRCHPRLRDCRSRQPPGRRSRLRPSLQPAGPHLAGRSDPAAGRATALMGGQTVLGGGDTRVRAGEAPG